MLSKIYSFSCVSVTAIMLGDFECTDDWNCSSLLTMLLALVYITVSQLESDAGLSLSSMAELSLEGLNTSVSCFGTKTESVIFTIKLVLNKEVTGVDFNVFFINTAAHQIPMFLK